MISSGGDDPGRAPRTFEPGEPRLPTRRNPDDPDAPTTPRDDDNSGNLPFARQPHNEAPSPRRSRFGRRLLHGLLLLLLAVLIALLALALWLRHSMRAALPQLDGAIHLAALTAPVTVTRDTHGVPSINAANLDDLLFAQGYITAQDRLWQMDMLRRHAAGDLAELLGPSLVPHDRLQRYLQLRNAADRAVAALPQQQLHQLTVYARGVNAFIDTHRNTLPVEFHLLHYAPAPWTPRDCLLIDMVMWQDLTTSFPTKLDRESLARHLPASLLTDLYPVGSWRDHPPTEAPPDLTAPHDVEEIPLDNTQARNAAPTQSLKGSLDAARNLLAVTRSLSAPCTGCRAGSNNWAVAGSRSASGAPLVSNDMHLGLSVPDIWYEVTLHAASTPAGTPLDVAGFTLPGLPFVIVGRNAHVAWGFTNLGADVQDIFVEHLRGSGDSTEFQRADGIWTAVLHHRELIRVRGGHDVALDVLATTHSLGVSSIETPILSPLFRHESRALALAWTLYDPTAVAAPFLAVDAAPDGASLTTALNSFGGPSINLVYADDQGHIGYHAIGEIPVRGPAVQHPRALPEYLPPPPEPESEEDDAGPSAELAHPSLLTVSYTRRRRIRRAAPRAANTAPDTTPATAPQPAPRDVTIGSAISPVPVDALDPLQQWSGYIPFDQLPAIQDPPGGYLVTANSRITPDDFPYAVTLDWADAYRAERISHLLESRTALTPSSMLAIQMDQHSDFDRTLAERLAYALDHASPAALSHDRRRLAQAANLLRGWRGKMSAGSPAAAIVSAAHAELWPLLLSAQIARHDHISRSDAAVFARLYSWGERTTALEDLLLHMSPRWLPPGFANWNDLLTSAVELGLQHNSAPRNLAGWTYGSVHRIEIDNPLFAGRTLLPNSIVDRLLGAHTGTGAQPAGGDATTVDAIGQSFGPSERFTADLANPAATLANITTGESGNPASPTYLDQFPAWLHGTSFPLPLQQTHAAHTLTLTPR